MAARDDGVLRGIEEGPEMGFYAERQALQVVAAFEDGYQTAIRVIGCDGEGSFGHFGEAFFRHTSRGQWVVDVCIESGRDDDELRFEFIHRRQQFFIEYFQVFVVTRSADDRRIQRRSHPFSVPLFLTRTCPRIVRVLVDAEVKDGGVILQDVLRSIPVVNVPIKNQNTLDTVRFLRIPRCNDNIVEQAETHRTAVLGVVTGGADGTEGAI